MKIAIICTREPSPEMITLCKKMAAAFRDLGCDLVTGNADGIDGVSRDTWNERHPERVTLVLPWRTYNANLIVPGNRVIVFDEVRHKVWADSVRRYHPAGDRLRGGALKLHARNYGIVEMAAAVIAFPNDGREGGGTGQGIRVARALSKPLFVLPGDIDKAREFYKSLANQPPATGCWLACDTRSREEAAYAKPVG